MSVDIGFLQDDLYKEAEDFLSEKGDLGLEKVKEYTPEDTFDLQKGNKRTGISREGTKLSCEVYNETEHAEYVEYSSTEKNYYKGGGRRKGSSPFVSGNGAGMFRKAANYLENE